MPAAPLDIACDDNGVISAMADALIDPAGDAIACDIS